MGFGSVFPSYPTALAEITRDPSTTLEREQWVPRTAGGGLPFFSDVHNLEHLTPPFLKFRILAVSTPTLEPGTRIDYRLSLHGVPVRWQSLIRIGSPNRSFVGHPDARSVPPLGPYARVRALRGGTIIRDRVHYELPLGALGGVVAGGLRREGRRRDLRLPP